MCDKYIPYFRVFMIDIALTTTITQFSKGVDKSSKEDVKANKR